MSKFDEIIDVMKLKSMNFVEGLKEYEFRKVEKKFHFEFPDDLREFLTVALPVNSSVDELKAKENPNYRLDLTGFPDWRKFDTDSLYAQLNSPLEGIWFDIEHNGFWLEEWGKKPKGMDEAKAKVVYKFQDYPKLIPIFGHRYIPEKKYGKDNPVFSVMQTDIIYFGDNLLEYLINEFERGPGKYILAKSPKKVPFWSNIVEK